MALAGHSAKAKNARRKLGRAGVFKKAARRFRVAAGLKNAGRAAFLAGTGAGVVGSVQHKSLVPLVLSTAIGSAAMGIAVPAGMAVEGRLFARLVGKPKSALAIARRVENPEANAILRGLASMKSLNLTERESIKAFFEGKATQMQENVAKRLLKKHVPPVEIVIKRQLGGGE